MIPCIRRSSYDRSETMDLVGFCEDVIGDRGMGVLIAERMLAGGEPYEYNVDAPEPYEEFTVADADALRADIADMTGRAAIDGVRLVR